MSLHQRRTHPVPVEGCFGCHASTVGLLDPGRAGLWKVRTDHHDGGLTVDVKNDWAENQHVTVKPPRIHVKATTTEVRDN